MKSVLIPFLPVSETLHDPGDTAGPDHLPRRQERHAQERLQRPETARDTRQGGWKIERSGIG